MSANSETFKTVRIIPVEVKTDSQKTRHMTDHEVLAETIEMHVKEGFTFKGFVPTREEDDSWHVIFVREA